MRTSTRITVPAWIAVLLLTLAGSADAAFPLRLPKSGAMKSANAVLKKFLLPFVPGHVLSKAVDELLGQDVDSELEVVRRELDAELDERVKELESTSGESRVILQEQLEKVEAQLVNVDRALVILKGAARDTAAEVARLRTDQARLEEEIEALAQRTSALERRVDDIDRAIGDLDARVSDLELALISECLDLRSAPQLGVERFRVPPNALGTGSLLEDRHDSEPFTLRLRAYLNSCTGDLTQRGLLLQLSWITRGLDRDMTLYTNFKHIEPGGFDPIYMNNLNRLEYPLYRPLHGVDGQVLELFIPYAEIPFPATNRLALALVVAHDGQILYTLPDRVINCHFGQRVQCRWGR